ncbi:hypothetical protein KR200_001701 [Drosophila serrata]|nr:hypothetical protein KR200_001701 [Drosophila serrata]
MHKIKTSIKKGQSPNADAESADDLPEMETEKLENTDSSNEDTEEETEDGQQDCEEVENMAVEMDKEEEMEMEMEETGDGEKEYNQEELRTMNELDDLSPAALVAEVRFLDQQLYKLSQQEAREITRIKHLDIFGKNKRRSSK